MAKIKNSGLDQCDAEPLEQQQSGTSGAERVDFEAMVRHLYKSN